MIAEQNRVAGLVESASKLHTRIEKARQNKDVDPANAELYAVAASHIQKVCDVLVKISGNAMRKLTAR